MNIAWRTYYLRRQELSDPSTMFLVENEDKYNYLYGSSYMRWDMNDKRKCERIAIETPDVFLIARRKYKNTIYSSMKYISNDISLVEVETTKPRHKKRKKKRLIKYLL